MSSPLVSVVICHHTGDLIHKAVNSIKDSTFVTPEIIVVSSVKDLILHGVEHILFDTSLPARKRNIGIKFSRSKFVAFFDDDIEVTKYAIHEMLNVLKDDTIGMVFGKLLNMEHPGRFDEAGGFLTSTGFIWARAESGVEDYGQFNTTEPIFAGKSAACMVKRDIFWRSGGFDESFGILGEESDLAWRVWLQGYKVMYAPKSVTYHAFNTRFKPVDKYYTNERVYFNGCRNYLLMLLKNAPLRMLIIALPVQLLAWTTAAIGHLWHKNWKACLLILKAQLTVLCSLSRIMKKRRLVQKEAKVSHNEVFKIVLKNPPISYYVNRLKSYIRTGLHG